MRCLIINSYAGSLTLGAHATGQEIIGSYEDANYCLDVQKANFPNLEYREYQKDWPKQDLSQTFVIAHPPCSAFSLANNSPSARGVGSKAFECTKTVLRYAMENHALGVAIESVMGALGGAWRVHQDFADKYGYHLYRILENGCMFGAQWRERFWALFVKKGVAPESINITLTPKWQTVSQVVDAHQDGPTTRNLDKLLERQIERLKKTTELTDVQIGALLNPTDIKKCTALGTILWNEHYRKPDSTPQEKSDMFHKCIGGFASGQAVILAPDGYAPVLMGGSHWIYRGRNLSQSGWKLLMGFPVDYEFPEKPKNYRRDMQTGLSKGVMPPIAAWLLENVCEHLRSPIDRSRRQHGTEFGPTYQLTCAPNMIADFRIARSAWNADLAYVPGTPLPSLRQFDEDDAERVVQQADARLTRDAGGSTGREPTIEEAAALLARLRGEEPPPSPVEDKGVVELTPPKPTKPERVVSTEKRAAFRRGGEGRVKTVSLDGLDSHTVPDKKKAIYQFVAEWPSDHEGAHPQLDELIEALVNHDGVRCAYNATRWHVLQLVKGGQLEIITA